MTDPSRLKPTHDVQAVGLSIKEVGKTFGDRAVLDKISLDINPGSFHVLIGPSGCGKTTLLRTLGGLENPTLGSIDFYRHEENAQRESIQSFSGLSYGFQEPRLLPWLTVTNNIALPLTLRHASVEETKKRVDLTLERVGLSHAKDLYPHQLSGGMKMRAAIGRALVDEPSVLLLDEPFGALDEITKNRLDDELYQLWQSLGMTVVLVTHSLTEAVYLGEKIHVLAPNPGRVAGTIQVDLGVRTPETRLNAGFTEKVAEAHTLLLQAEGGGQ